MSQLTFPFMRKKRLPAVPWCHICHGLHMTHGEFIRCRDDSGFYDPPKSDEERYRQAMGQHEQ